MMCSNYCYIHASNYFGYFLSDLPTNFQPSPRTLVLQCLPLIPVPSSHSPKMVRWSSSLTWSRTEAGSIAWTWGSMVFALPRSRVIVTFCVCVCASSIYNMLQRRTKYHSHPNWIWHPIALSLAASDGHIVTSPHCTRSIHLTHCYGQGVEGSVSPPNLKIIGNIVSIKSGRTRNLGGRKIRNETWNTSQHLGRLKGR